MFGMRCIFALAIICKFEQSNSLMTLPKVEDNNIIEAESVIRTTINTLFSTIGLKNVKSRPRLKQYSLVHNYFVSLTLQDYNSLKEIAKLTKVDKNQTANDTVDYIALLNEILDEDNVAKLQSIIMGVDLKTDYDVLDEIEKLEYLKKHHEAQRDKNMKLNKEVLKILQREVILDLNVTTKAGTYYKENDYLLSDLPTWHEEKGALASGRRIYNGKRTKVKKFPFIASVQIFNKFQCGGSIIKSDLVITAASCLQLAWNNRFYRENPLFLSVRVGSSFYEAGGENIGVLEVYFYPSYNPKNLHHNLAVVRLVRKIKLKRKRVKKILLDTEYHGLPTNVNGIQILGWGARTGSNRLHGPWEDKLRFATLGIYSLADCQDIYSKEYVTQQHFCAGSVSVGSGACNRDVGGPGVVSGKLAGIVSFGSPQCGTPDAPTVFTKVGYYYDWIEEIMEQDVPTAKHRTTLPSPTYRYDLPDGSFNPWLIPPISTVRGFDVIKSTTKKNALRSEEKQMFKEYLKTMFESAEIEEYLDGMKDKSESIIPSAVEIQQTTSRQPSSQPIVQPLITKQSMKRLPVRQQRIKQKHSLKQQLLQLYLRQHALLQQPLIQQSIKQDPLIQQPLMQQLIMQQTTMQQPIIQQPIMQQPIMQQPIMQQPIMQQPIIKEPVTQTPDLKNVPEPKATAILEEATLFPTFNENAQESRESSKEEMYNSTVIIPYNTDPVTTHDRFSENLGTTLSLDLAMDSSSTSEEKVEQVDDSDNELKISVMDLNNKNIIRNEPITEAEQYVKKDQLSMTSAKTNSPHKHSKNKKTSKLLNNKDDKIDSELLTLLYLSDSELQGMGKGHKNKKNTVMPDNDVRKSSLNVSAIQPLDDLSYRQYSQLGNDLSILDLRKLLNDDDFLVKILNEELASGFNSMEVSESPLGVNNTSEVSQNGFSIKQKTK